MLNLNNDIPGWMGKNDLIVLATLASLVPNNSNILEIGSFLGRSTYTLFQNKPKDVSMTVVDPFKIDKGYCLDKDVLDINDQSCSIHKLDKAIEVSTYENSWRAGFELCIGKEIYNQLDVHTTDSRNFKIEKKYDMVFLDGSHIHADVMHDLIKYSNFDNLLVGDNFGKKHWGVPIALVQFIQQSSSKRTLLVVGGTKIWISIPSSGHWSQVFRTLNLTNIVNTFI